VGNRGAIALNPGDFLYFGAVTFQGRASRERLVAKFISDSGVLKIVVIRAMRAALGW